MFFVVEIQKLADGSWHNITTQHETQAEAESKYYTVLSYAAVSENLSHGAILFDDKGVYFMRKVYNNVG